MDFLTQIVRASTRSRTWQILAAAVVMPVVGQSVANGAPVVYGLQYQTNGSPLVSAGTPASAGAVSQSGFNVQALNYVNAGTNGATVTLADSTGDTSAGITETTGSDGAYDGPRGAGFSTGTGNYNLYAAFALGNFGSIPTVVVNIAGLDASHSYDLYAYVGAATNNILIEGTAGGVTKYAYSNNGEAAYLEGTDTTASDAATDKSNGNYFDYFKFSGLTNSTTQTFTLATTASDGNYTSLFGFQLVDTGVVPEPASLSLIGVGGLALLSRRRRHA